VDLDVRAKLQRLPQLGVMAPGVYEGSLPLVKEAAAAANAKGQEQAAGGGGTFVATDPRAVLSDEVKAWDVVPAFDGTTSWVWNPKDNQLLPPPVLWTIPNVGGVPAEGYSLRSSVQIALIGQAQQIDDTTNHKQRTIIDAITVFVGRGGIGNMTTEEAKKFYQSAMAFVQVYESQDQVPAGSTFRKGDVRKEFRDEKTGELDINKVIANFNQVEGIAYLARLAAQTVAAKDLGLHIDTARMEGPQAFVAVFSLMGQLTQRRFL